MQRFIKNRGRGWTIPAVLLLSGFAGTVLSSCSAYYFSRPLHTDIHKFRMVKIDGVKQAVMIRGNDRDNPVMVFLHGGPGFPLFPFEPSGETMRRLEEVYTMVYWEQRGTGKSFSRGIPPESMSIGQFVEDARLVTEYALEVVNQDKAFIWGHSWGSGVGALLAAAHPELIHAYLSTGQTVNPYQNERLNYEFVRHRALEENNRRALRQLQWIDTLPANYSLEDALTIRRWVYRFGGVVRQNGRERPYVDLPEIYHMLTASEYSLADRLNLVMSPHYSAKKLWEEMQGMDLAEDAPLIDVPVYFLLGRHDVIVSSKLAAEYFEKLRAPSGKTLVWFEHSAHRPHSEERKKFLETMADIRSLHLP